MTWLARCIESHTRSRRVWYFGRRGLVVRAAAMTHHAVLERLTSFAAVELFGLRRNDGVWRCDNADALGILSYQEVFVLGPSPSFCNTRHSGAGRNRSTTARPHDRSLTTNPITAAQHKPLSKELHRHGQATALRLHAGQPTPWSPVCWRHQRLAQAHLATQERCCCGFHEPLGNICTSRQPGESWDPATQQALEGAGFRLDQPFGC